jgi:PBSX family phage terminase large subunit
MIEFSPKQKEIIRAPFSHTLEVNEGTPRSGKTTAGHFRFSYYLTVTPDENHLIVAYNQEQAYRLFVDGDGTGLLHIFEDLAKPKSDRLGDHLEIHTPTGLKKVYYKGGGKVDSVKAITGMSLGSVVFCEINLLHPDMVQECFRRTFAAKMRYHLADLNPPAPNHPIIKEVFEVQNTSGNIGAFEITPSLAMNGKQRSKQR